METLELANTVTKKNLHYTILDVKISLKKVLFLIIAEFEKFLIRTYLVFILHHAMMIHALCFWLVQTIHNFYISFH